MAKNKKKQHKKEYGDSGLGRNIKKKKKKNSPARELTERLERALDIGRETEEEFDRHATDATKNAAIRPLDSELLTTTNDAATLAFRRQRRIPELYRAALAHQWAHVYVRCTTFGREASFVNQSDGTTALHLAVISRATSCGARAVLSLTETRPLADIWDLEEEEEEDDGPVFRNRLYNNNTNNHPAPLRVIQALLSANPDAVRVKCLRLGYTPLAYACLVPPRRRRAAARQHPAKEVNGKRATEKQDMVMMMMSNAMESDEFEDRSETMRSLVEWGYRTGKQKRGEPQQLLYDRMQRLVEKVVLGVPLRGQNHHEEEPIRTQQDEIQDLVKLLLAGGDQSDAVWIRSDSGLTPVEIHVISYSHAHRDDDDLPPKGRILSKQQQQHDACCQSLDSGYTTTKTTTTGVLRVLLDADPSLVTPNTAKHSDSPGPLELLYVCNCSKILQVMEHPCRLRSRTHPRRPQLHAMSEQESGFNRCNNKGLLLGPSGFSCPSLGTAATSASSTTGAAAASCGNYNNDNDDDKKKNGAVLDLGSWWVWQWLLLLLKRAVGSKAGTPFMALHAAARTEGCPLPFLMLLMRVFPHQLKTPDRRESMLPLHLVCQWGAARHLYKSTAASWRRRAYKGGHCRSSTRWFGANVDPIVLSRKRMAISALVREYPGGTSALNAKGETPLVCALRSDTRWDGGLCRLVKRGSTAALTIPDPVTHLYPFLLAASSSRDDGKCEQRLWLSTIYELLRACPKVIQTAQEPVLEPVSLPKK